MTDLYDTSSNTSSFMISVDSLELHDADTIISLFRLVYGSD